jgi:predicted glycosyltransferase involved in capsule biosynthesis
MLSVLIPVFNFDVCELVHEISNQAVKAKVLFEILVIDDASHEDFKIINREITQFEGVTYIEEKKNLGRSKIRNKLADLSKYNNLLFLDCDSKIVRKNFLINYLRNIDTESVIYGGREYDSINPEDGKYKLHWLHGIKREQIPAIVRAEVPNKSFMTNNFIISKKAFNKVRFNEMIKGYGHEDTLFGYDLASVDIVVRHIDNPVIHMGLESNEEFLRKTKEGIKNLKRIMSINGNAKKLIKDITLLAYYKKIKTLRLTGFLSYLYVKSENHLCKNLLSGNPSLILFDFYKLGYLCSLEGELK